MTISIILVFFSSLVLSAAASCAPMRGEQNRMKTSNDWCESNVCVCLCFFPSYLSLSLVSPLLSRLIVMYHPYAAHVSFQQHHHQNKAIYIHTYTYQQLFCVCVCVPKVEYHPSAIRLQRGISIIIIIIVEEEER